MEKNELMNSSVVQLYYSSTFNYVQLNYNNINVHAVSTIQHLTSNFDIGGVMRFFKNASKKLKQCRKQTPFAILRGRAQKDVSPFTLEKVQKRENM